MFSPDFHLLNDRKKVKTKKRVSRHFLSLRIFLFFLFTRSLNLTLFKFRSIVKMIKDFVICKILILLFHVSSKFNDKQNLNITLVIPYLGFDHQYS